MCRKKLLGVLLLCCCAAIGAEETINLSGKVTNADGKPIKEAEVRLVVQDLADTTKNDGTYSIEQVNVVRRPNAFHPQSKNIVLEKGYLEFQLPEVSPVTVEVFDLKGKLVKKEATKNAQKGVYRFNLDKSFQTNLLIIRASIGGTTFNFRYVPMQGAYLVSQSINKSVANISGNKLAKVFAISDTLRVRAANYAEKLIPINSYEQELDITLDTLIPFTGSAGCGKVTSLTSGTHQVTSSGKGRTYIINIPQNYDKDKPYRLIFGMHCMGGSAHKVANVPSDEQGDFYHLKPISEQKNIPCIFVAPQGNDNGTWNGQEDHTFFSDLLKLFKDELCVDTTRVFSVGFSFGAMFSYSLSTSFQNELRAVSCFAPVNYVIWLPQHKHLPLAYMQMHGMQDGTCPWNAGAAQGGEACVLDHAKDNGCTLPGRVQTGNHIIYEFEGCNEGYPVQVGTFQGAHDLSNNRTWFADETWKFFMRF